jgi:hypothetical protein
VQGACSERRYSVTFSGGLSFVFRGRSGFKMFIGVGSFPSLAAKAFHSRTELI